MLIYCGGRKIIFPLSSESLAETPVIEERLTREKQTNLLTHVPAVYMGDTQGKMSHFLSGLEFRFKYHDNRKEERG